jgi:PPM family protein phosphatase
MAFALRYAVRSDVGLLREGNEDSAYAGPRLLAVADGMGGYAAGEVASAAVISAIAGLDLRQVPEDELAAALSEAVAEAKRALREIVSSDPAVSSMGTTLTAMLLSGETIALCHIGDSRAYLLRDRKLYQITKDHTFVQALVDQGRITPDEVATHPQRSLLLRALDGKSDADPDISLLAAHEGDRYLLCSDGLPVAVSDEQLLEALVTVTEPDDLVLALVDLANRGGGPDNITCIVADVIDTATAGAAPTQRAVAAGAASGGGSQAARPVTQPAGPLPGDGMARGRDATALALAPDTRRAGRTETLAADDAAAAVPRPRRHSEQARRSRPRRRWPVLTSILVILVLVIGGAAAFGYWYLRSQYYVGVDHGKVAIFRGVHDRVLGVSLSGVSERTQIPISSVPANDAPAIRTTIALGSLAQARRVVANIRKDYAACQVAAAELQAWIAGKPKPVKVHVRINGKQVTRTRTPRYRPRPAARPGCPPVSQPTGQSPSPAPSTSPS